jgi:hypothetical protein
MNPEIERERLARELLLQLPDDVDEAYLILERASEILEERMTSPSRCVH